MATIVVLKNKKTGKKQSMYSVDAREVLRGPQKDDWEFVKRLGRTAKIVEPGIAAEKVQGENAGAVEFHGEGVLQRDAKVAVSPSAADPVDEVSSAENTPQAPRGVRGGGKQEPAKKDDDK